METVSQHLTQLNQKNQEHSVLENRITQLKQQLNLQQANNNILKTKVDKIVSSKKQKFYDEMKLKEILQSDDVNNNGIQYMIQRNKTLLKEELRQSKQDMLEEKYLQIQQMKQKLDLEMFINQKKRDQQLFIKQQQYAKISEWEFNLKLNLKQREIDKIDKIRLEEKEFKEQLAKRMQQQQQHCDQLSNEEQQLISKLRTSQQFENSLKYDLKTAMNLSIKDYTNNVSIPTQFKQYNSSKILKETLNSPYAQLPTMLKIKMSEQINKSQNNNQSLMNQYQCSLPSLCKPSLIEQQQQVERLFQSKSVKNSKSDLHQMLNQYNSKSIIEKKSKFNQSEILQNQSIKQNRKLSQDQEQLTQDNNKQEIEILNQNQQEEEYEQEEEFEQEQQ